MQHAQTDCNKLLSLKVNDGRSFIHERYVAAYQNRQWCIHWQVGRDKKCRLGSAQQIVD